MSTITVPTDHYLNLLDNKLNQLRHRFDIGKHWEMEEALSEARRITEATGYRREVVDLMETDLRTAVQESRESAMDLQEAICGPLKEAFGHQQYTG